MARTQTERITSLSSPTKSYIDNLTRLVLKKEGKRLKRRRYVNPGPNFACHTDGYDKLKPYGFPIHGCIDGFRLIWLKVSRTNNDPAVSEFFRKAVQIEGGCPVILRTDNGTENTVMASVQSFFCDQASWYVYFMWQTILVIFHKIMRHLKYSFMSI